MIGNLIFKNTHNFKNLFLLLLITKFRPIKNLNVYLMGKITQIICSYIFKTTGPNFMLFLQNDPNCLE